MSVKMPQEAIQNTCAITESLEKSVSGVEGPD